MVPFAILALCWSGSCPTFGCLTGTTIRKLPRSNFDDGKALLFAGRYDGVAYLSGYVLECSIKSVLMLMLRGQPPGVQPLPRRLRHHRLRKLSGEALRLALVTSSGAFLGYLPTRVQSNWSAALRYAAPRIGLQQALDCLAEAEEVYQTSVARMRLHGVVF